MRVSVTESEGQTDGQPSEGDDVSEPQLARARDAQDTPEEGQPGDTERRRDVLGDFLEGASRTVRAVWSGEAWDAQPPSPRELAQRCRDSQWANSEAGVKVILAWAGCVLSILWTVPLYTLAVLGHTAGRASLSVVLVAGFWHFL